MSGPDIILRQFGERASLPDLAFGARGHAVFQSENGRLLGIERVDDGLLVYVSQPMDYEAGAWFLRACKRAHHHRLDDWAVQPALREQDGRQHLLVATRIHSGELTENRLQRALEYLSQWLDALRDES